MSWESLLSTRDFFQILEHAIKEEVKVGLTTNGSRLGGETGKRLLDYDLHQIDVSLQTPGREIIPNSGGLDLFPLISIWKGLSVFSVLTKKNIRTRFLSSGL